jgi:hypothetical protein
MKIARELASISFGRHRRGVLVPLRAYFDGSGKEGNDPVITVGGFFADASLCTVIEDEWEIATNGEVFHLADFGTVKCQLGSRQWDATKRVEFLKRLASIVNRPGSKIVSASIEVAPYLSFLAKSPHAHVNGPAFSGCAQVCVQVAELLINRLGLFKDRVSYVFELGDRQHELHKAFSDLIDAKTSLRGIRGLSFEPKDTTLLQPADLIAGIVQRCVLSAHSALPCLDGGKSRTSLNVYEHHYSADGVTSSVVSGHDCDGCWIINPKTFDVLDLTSTDFFERHPNVLTKRLKQTPYKPKAKRRANE